MAELLLELYSEEIPGGMQKPAAEAIANGISARLKEAGIKHNKAEYYYTPQRVVTVIQGLEKNTPEQNIERRGPRLNAPEQAISGFCKGLAIDTTALTKEGDYYFYRGRKKGQQTADILPKIISDAITAYTWPKSMAWGDYDFKWARPLHSLICLLDGQVIPVKIGHIAASNTTKGHRFMAANEISVSSWDSYKKALAKNKVLLEQDARREFILAQALKLAEQHNVNLIKDQHLLDEVTGLIEYPVILAGKIDSEFLDIPKEVLITSMKTNQKYFSTTDKDGNLAPIFIMVSNIESADNGAEITTGNERVLRARLADAKFFWDTDRKTKLESNLPKLDKVIFHQKIGSYLDKTKRLEKLAKQLSKTTNADKNAAVKTAKLCKTDLVSNMVDEFPSLQGIMGGYYANDKQIGDAIKDHYKPQGANDECPTDPLTVTVALADKIDNLRELISAGERATGSKDPYGLRRNALGIIRLVLENNLRLNLVDYFNKEQIDFIKERLKHRLKAQGLRHDAIDAANAGDDIALIANKVEALDSFLNAEQGKMLAEAYKRTTNILSIESKRYDTKYTIDPVPYLFKDNSEIELYNQLNSTSMQVSISLEQEDFNTAMNELTKLQPYLSDFFNSVMVNDEDPKIRENRLLLLNKVKDMVKRIADFDKLEG